ncbi:Fanconi anemia group I protein isoform X2 [Ixodes scapularis]|uniref:Fanconi anemia group I protein isoform X2 n=1 Tax=Ixodes scapularis TaxID=6945 RepID=UPI001C38FC11|nr:Fanconi anemia group I protein isoform X2 [Ixodes scapularis]
MDKESVLEKLRGCIKSKNLKLVYDFLMKNALKGGADLPSVAGKLIEELPDNEFGRDQHVQIFTTLLNILKKVELTSKISSEVLSILNTEVDHIPVNSLADVVHGLIDSLKEGIPLDGRWLEMLPQLLTTIAASETVAARGDTLSGVQFKKLIVESLCSCAWEPKWATPLARILSEIPLDSSELEFAVPKMMRVLPDLELAEVPPLVYQLLLFANQEGIEVILETVIKFFAQKEKDLQCNGASAPGAKENLEQTEATVTLHVVFAARQNLVITRTIVKMLKARQIQASFIFSQFTLTLALALTKMHPFAEQMLDVLKAAVSSNALRHVRYKESFWVREMIPKPQDPRRIIVNMIQHSKCGWEESSQSLAELGFLLMDAFGPRTGFGRGPNTAISNDCCQLGLSIILEIFKVNKIACYNILDLLSKRLLPKTTAPVEHYFELFARMIQACPQLLVQCQARIQQLLGQLPNLPCHTTTQLLRAATPLIKVSLALRDWLMIMLRKLVFHRELESRKVAVSGILILLRNLKSLEPVGLHGQENEFTLSQIRVEVSQPSDPSSHRAVCMELLGLLNKCLTQQGSVRQLLYQGLPEVISQNINLSGAVLELLLVQLEKYYSEDKNSYPPLKLSGIVQINMDKAVLQEPLSQLVLCIHRCLSVCDKHAQDCSDNFEECEGVDPKSKLQKLMQSLTSVMVDAELEDFSLDKMSDFSTTSAVGQKNRLLAMEIMWVCEALMEHSLWSANWSATSAQVAVKLFSQRSNMEQVLRNPSKKKDGKTAPAAALKKSLPSLLSAEFLEALLKNLFCSASEYEGLSELLENGTFMQYMVTAARNELVKVQNPGTFEALYHDRLLGSHFRIARVFLQVCKQQSKSADATLPAICIESLGNLVSSVTKQHQVAHLPVLLATLEAANMSEQPNLGQLIESQFRVYKSLVNDILSLPGDENPRLKELVPIMLICSALSHFIELDSDLFSELRDWMKGICKEQSISDPVVSRSLVSFFLTVNHQTAECLRNLAHISGSVYSNLGDIDEDVEPGRRQTYAVISPKTAGAVTTVLLDHLHKIQERIDWLLGVMKCYITLETRAKERTGAELSNRQVEEVGLCRQLGYLVAIFVELTQCRLPPGPCVEGVMKQLTRLYNSLSGLSKLYLCLYSSKQGGFCNKFEKLVKLAATELTPQVYAMITFLQSAEPDGPPKMKKQRRNEIQKAVVAKELSIIPSLIYAIEQHERLLIQLVKKSKVNLMEGAKMSTARDFRINSATVQALLEESAEADENEDDDGDASGEPSARCSAPVSCAKKPERKRSRKAVASGKRQR